MFLMECSHAIDGFVGGAISLIILNEGGRGSGDHIETFHGWGYLLMVCCEVSN